MVSITKRAEDWPTSLEGVRAVGDTSEISKLIEDYDKSKARYDYWLGEAYGNKWSEEKCKLFAREKVRMEGLKEPDTYRWLLRWKLGSILD